MSMRYDKSWEDLGSRIREEVDRAVNSQDFQNMAKNIRQTVETVVDLGGETVRRAARTVQESQKTQAPRPEPKVQVSQLYGKTGGRVVGGIVKIALGGMFALSSIVTGGLLLAWELTQGALVCGGVLAGSGLLLTGGIRDMNTASRFRTYRKTLGQKTQCAIEKLARAVGRDAQFVRKDLKKMIGKGYFLEGHLDHEQNHLITSNATYRQFEQARLQLEAAQRQRAAEAAAAPDPRIREVLDKGGAFLAQIRKCNDDIPGEEVSAKIYQMELIVERIFARAKEHPEVIPDLKKLMDYYLPMTVKLLTAYADMDAQPVQGGNIESAKREIEGTLDTLNRAFEKLLDELFQETALDVSSDITVLQTLLAQEG
ncbi:MAG: 5-bromo-4-chloroindolyl phosphate hydrolysis family protein, partial [Oscillospiraceae bacterium]|nr:5-bromo-4-chloroindolyl phosphate hydrolysis family protein [Oscillospiraceae bacterium]